MMSQVVIDPPMLADDHQFLKEGNAVWLRFGRAGRWISSQLSFRVLGTGRKVVLTAVV